MCGYVRMRTYINLFQENLARCGVEQESTKNPEQSSKSLFERGQKVNRFSAGIFSLKYEQEGGAREPYPILYQVLGTWTSNKRRNHRLNVSLRVPVPPDMEILGIGRES